MKHQVENQIFDSIISKDGSYSTTYELTEYGIIFHKLYLLTELVCEHNEKINKTNDYYCSSKIKEYLKSKQITLYHFDK